MWPTRRRIPYALDLLAWSVEQQRARRAIVRSNRCPAGTPTRGSDADSRWVDEFNEFNRRQLAGENDKQMSFPIKQSIDRKPLDVSCNGQWARIDGESGVVIGTFDDEVDVN